MTDSHIVQIPEIIVPGKRLGRHIDQRTAGVRTAGGPPPLAANLHSVNHVSSPNMPLNQGEAGSCTGNATVGAVNTAPHWKVGRPALNETNAVAIYSKEEQDLGYGPYPPNDNGGTGQAACEAAIQLGICNNYQVAANIHEALLALMLKPVITGVDWYDSFDTPDANGLVAIAPGATVRGGHEIVATQLIVPSSVNVTNMLENLDQILVGLWQSWGSWGFQNSGRFFWSAATWATLLSQGGDVTVPRTA